MSRTRPGKPERRPKSRTSAKSEPQATATYSRGTRETIESVVVAIILAFLFRSFVGEAFVIPTGSMAPTLQGKHKDVRCAQCNYSYRTGASIEDSGFARVISTTCPVCRFTMNLDQQDANHVSFTGDRIVVSKFAYDLSDPKRWDVIVFKYPGNAKQNYIKRLVGLPGETLQIRHGDVFVRTEGDDDFRIARKPEHKLLATLQLVHDANYFSPALRDAGWPVRWSDLDAPDGGSVWTLDDNGKSYSATAGSSDVSWLRYRHLPPFYEDWYDLARGREIPEIDKVEGQLISDFYAYNAYGVGTGYEGANAPPGSLGVKPDRVATGLHWVGDLAVECTVEVRSDTGELSLKLVEGGVHYDCAIDVATGRASLTMKGGQGGFGEKGAVTANPTASTQLQGPGRYNLRYANVDDEIWLWVNNRRVEFSSPTTFRSPKDIRPVYSEEDYGDLAPLGIGTKGVDVSVSNLRVLRDVYYISTIGGPSQDRHYGFKSEEEILTVFNDPARWADSSLFDWDALGPVEFRLEEDQFFPMGDNSPQSKDARLWEGDPYVERKLLTGKALFIYWPHAWNKPIPFWPNFARMGLIR